MTYLEKCRKDVADYKNWQDEAMLAYNKAEKLEKKKIAAAKRKRFDDIIYRIIVLACTVVQLAVGFELIHWSKWMTDSPNIHWYDLVMLIAGTLMIVIGASNVIMLRVKTYFEKECHR